MLQGVLQKLTIIENTQTRLVLIERPLLDWGVAGLLGLIGLALLIAQFWLSALVAFIVSAFFLLQAQSRLVIFDRGSQMFEVHMHAPFRREVIQQRPLHDIQGAVLHCAEDGSTQILLVDIDGEELGLSVYSNDVANWKEPIVIAINAILHQNHSG